MKAVIFLEKGTSDDNEACSRDVGEMLTAGNWHVSYASTGELAAALTAKPQLYVQPGGNYDVKQIWQKLTRTDKDAVRAYVAAGGAYLGICLGAFLAGKGFYEVALADQGPVQDKKGMVKAQLANITWAGKPRKIYTEEPPELGKLVGGAKRHILSAFADGSAHVVVEPYKLGVVGLIAGHPEATPDWGDGGKLVVAPKLAQDIGLAVAKVLRQGFTI